MFNNINFDILLKSISLGDIFAFFQSIIFLRWIFLLFIIFYFVFIAIVINQIRAMNKTINQQSSSAILLLISFILVAISIVLFIFVLKL